MARSKDQQCKEIVEGLGLGLLEMDFDHVSNNKFQFEMSFSHAWRKWGKADCFPSVDRAREPENEVWLRIRKSGGRRGRMVEWFEDDGHRGCFFIRLTQGDDWTPAEACRIASSVPLEDWVSLARVFKSELDRFN